MRIHLFLALSAALTACPLHSFGQAPAPAGSCTTGKPLAVADLADNADAQIAARGLASQIVYSYEDFVSKNPGSADKFTPNISGFVDAFNARILADLIGSQFCQSAQKAAINVGTAVAATSQTNKQVSAPSTASGTTSVTEKTAVTQLLGIAVQDGAINNNVTGNTMTLSTSGYGIVSGFGWIKDTASDYADWGGFTRLGASATFNVTNASATSSSSTATGTSNTLANATHRQISQWQAKFTFRDTTIRSKAVSDIFNGQVSDKKTLDNYIRKSMTSEAGAASLRTASQTVVNDLSSPRFAAIVQPLDNLFAPVGKAATPSEATISMWVAINSAAKSNPDCSGTITPDPCLPLEQAILKWLAAYRPSEAGAPTYTYLSSVAAIDPTVLKLISKYATDEASYLTTEKTFEADVKNLQAGWNGALTFGEQYPATGAATTTTTTAATTTTSTKPSSPAYLISGLDISWQHKTNDPNAVESGIHFQSWTTNLAGSVYMTPIAALNEQTFRGGTASTAFEWNFGKSPFLTSAADKSQITFSLSGQYQRLQENEDQKGKKSDLVLGNAKLEFPISSGVSFPLSVTVANSSEQVKETYVRGNFGISFDLSTLAALLKAKQ